MKTNYLSAMNTFLGRLDDSSAVRAVRHSVPPCLTAVLSPVELQPVAELDSLEYLEALEMVTFKLETRVNFCKAHLMMITCFDVSSKRR